MSKAMTTVDLTELRKFVDRGSAEERAAARWRIVELSAAREAAASIHDGQTLREIAAMLDEMRVLYPEFAAEVDGIAVRAREDLRRLGIYEEPLREAEAMRAAGALAQAETGAPRARREGIRVTTAFDLPGAETTDHLGEVFGLVVTSRAAYPGAGVEPGSLGGELRAMTHLLEAARETAIERMVEQARTFGADAVVGLRFHSAALADGWAEICAYGTAVKVRPKLPGLDSNQQPSG
jgi:uncharacterized protein YbjQ (UPF0145 family)